VVLLMRPHFGQTHHSQRSKLILRSSSPPLDAGSRRHTRYSQARSASRSDSGSLGRSPSIPCVVIPSSRLSVRAYAHLSHTFRGAWLSQRGGATLAT
jgi:hypothetical protein